MNHSFHIYLLLNLSVQNCVRVLSGIMYLLFYLEINIILNYMFSIAIDHLGMTLRIQCNCYYNIVRVSDARGHILLWTSLPRRVATRAASTCPDVSSTCDRTDQTWYKHLYDLSYFRFDYQMLQLGKCVSLSTEKYCIYFLILYYRFNDI